MHTLMRCSARPDKLLRCLPIAFALVFFVQAFYGSLNESLTFDEPVFIASGYSYLTRNDFRLNKEAPPLMQELAALPLLGMGLKQPSAAHTLWQQGEQFGYARFFMLQNAEKILDLTMRARFPVILLGCALILAIGFWGQQLYGPGPALVGLAAAALSPNLLAHAKVATTDLGCTFFMFVAVFTFWRAGRSDKVADWIICGICTGLALLAKYTALLLGPIYLCLAAIMMARRRTPLPATVRGLVIVAFCAFIAVGAGYNFKFDYSLYLNGMKGIYQNLDPKLFHYLLGSVAEEPRWYFYIAAFFLKVPVPTLILLGLAVYYAARDVATREATIFLLVPALFMIGASCFDQVNFGIRRILPALPFLLLFTAQALACRPGRFRISAVVLLLVWLGIEAAVIYPHHLSYINVAAGGPARGPYLLAYSNIDWGQDLPSLARWQQAHPEARPLKFSYFGNIFPVIYGIDAELIDTAALVRPQAGTYAISAHHLALLRKLKKLQNLDIDWLTKYKPVARAGYSIYIYQFR